MSALRKRDGAKLTLQRVKLEISTLLCSTVLTKSKGAGLEWRGTGYTFITKQPLKEPKLAAPPDVCTIILTKSKESRMPYIKV